MNAMYVPKSFQFDNPAEKIAFMQRYPFATLVTVAHGLPLATHLPFVVEEKDGKVILSSHFAAGNSQTQYVETGSSLVIFSEPHAYISPRHYDKQESVPTWDYIAVHAYGKCRIEQDADAKLILLEKMIRFYEPNYLQQWTSLSHRFRMGMLSGLTAFTLEVTELQGQRKLSQNKTITERTRIIRQLEESPVGIEQDLAKYIQNTLK